MAKDIFNSLDEKKVQKFFSDFQRVFFTKQCKDVTVDDVLETTSISRATFYNYFTDMSDFFNSLIEFYYKYYYSYCFNMLSKHSNSIFAATKAVYNEIVDFLNDNPRVAKAVANFLVGSPQIIIIKFLYSPELETFIINKLADTSAKTQEGKRMNNLSYTYSLVSTLSTYIIVSLMPKLIKLIQDHPENNSVFLDDFDFKINLLKAGFDQTYKKNNKASR